MKTSIIVTTLAFLALPASLPAFSAGQTPEEMRREIEQEFARMKAEDQSKAAAADKSRQAWTKIAPHALSSYRPDQYPKTYATWGANGVARIVDHERRAAELVASRRECDVVDYVGLSNRSIPPSRIVVFVDCKNKQRFHVGAGELANGSPRRPHESLAD
ncbi:MAG: hypothetical protein JSR28_03165 [Proteobacteria bacterium]|nr:hypothetical protein [Pseudomonadota bacterium]